MSSITNYTPEQRKRRAAAAKRWKLANPDKVKAQPCNSRKEAAERLREWRKRKREVSALTTAAPLLLEALQSLLIVADHPNNPMRTGAGGVLIEQARAAIAKAKGVTL